jgi:chitin synthase
MSEGVDTSLHLFENTLHLEHLKRNSSHGNASPRNMTKGVMDYLTETTELAPLQAVYALKEQNAGKLNSHLWFFNGFAEQLRPEFTVLLDVGTMAEPSSIYRLLRSMVRNDMLGGVCGEISVDKALTPKNLCNFVVAAQNYEYKIANIMDKSTESVFGFISVLPGAFSAYRYDCIRGAPLTAYFKSIEAEKEGVSLSAFEGNMYLAEDRILCFELLVKKGRGRLMHFCKDAVAFTDVPETCDALIKQRRRWLNGSFFATIYALLHFDRMYRESGHTLYRKALLSVQLVYMSIVMALSFTLMANFYLSFHFVFQLAIDSQHELLPDKWEISGTMFPVMLYWFQMGYVAAIVIIFIVSLVNKPQDAQWFFQCVCVFFGLVMSMTVTIAVVMVGLKLEGMKSDYGLQEELAKDDVVFVILLLCTSSFFYIGPLMHGPRELFHILATSAQYFFMLPFFINVLNIYAFSNIHDLSWGTKGLEAAGGHGEGGGVKKTRRKKKTTRNAAETNGGAMGEVGRGGVNNSLGLNNSRLVGTSTMMLGVSNAEKAKRRKVEKALTTQVSSSCVQSATLL